MKLEEVLPEYRNGRKVKRKSCNVTLTDYITLKNLSMLDLMADDWEVVPKPPLTIDLIEYADGFEFIFGETNYYVELMRSGIYGIDSCGEYKYLGCVYMTQGHANELADKLNSGEWVLK